MSAFFGFLAFAAFIVFIIALIKPQKLVFWTQKKTRGMACLYLAAVVVFGAISGACGSSNSSSVPSANTMTSSTAASSNGKAQSTASASAAPVSSSAPTAKAYSATLLPGYYEIGTDIPAGTYNFEIVSGSGNVTTTSGEINLIMGKQSGDMYQKTYKNAELNADDVLFVQQCSIKISTQAANMQIKKRDNSTAKAISFSSGKYTVGKDFQPGYYDITLVSGSGNVVCEDNELNAIISNDSSFGVKEYKNVPFKSGNKLDIEGPKVKLTPSK